MVKTPIEGISYLPLVLNAGPGALAEGKAVILSSAYGASMTRSFLAKQVHMRLMFDPEAGSTSDKMLVGLANGSMTAAEIEDAVKTVMGNPNDTSNWDDYAMTLGIFWQTLRFISNGTAAFLGAYVDETIKLGGGKGIPYLKGVGVSLFGFNPAASSVASGNFITGSVCHVGVFLDDS